MKLRGNMVKSETLYVNSLPAVSNVGVFIMDGDKYNVHECGGGGNCGPLCLQYLVYGTRHGADRMRFNIYQSLKNFISSNTHLGMHMPDGWESRSAFVEAEHLCLAAWYHELRLIIFVSDGIGGIHAVSTEDIRTSANKHKPRNIYMLMSGGDGGHFQALMPMLSISR